MANIAINDIRPAGTELFMDSESFLLDLNHDEISNVNGGVTPYAVVALVSAVASYISGRLDD